MTPTIERTDRLLPRTPHPARLARPWRAPAGWARVTPLPKRERRPSPDRWPRGGALPDEGLDAEC
ncbi:MAG TPA: hypothetical protein VFJ82_15710 [Longimicrobium sp.]|nr:hypothetical protein [Longimicrobium sp.]